MAADAEGAMSICSACAAYVELEDEGSIGMCFCPP